MASTTVSELYIGGQEMPAPLMDGVTITKEKIWSTDTGRTSSGEMVGTIIAIKSKVSIKWPPLTPEEVAKIESAVSNADSPFTDLKYIDVDGNSVTKTVYFGTPSYTWHTWKDGKKLIQDVTVNGIEQ